MRGTEHDRPRELSSPNPLTDLKQGDVLCDRHRRECYQVTSVDRVSVGLRRGEADFSVPRSLFVSWHGRRLFPVEHSRTIEVPEWCSRDRVPSRRDANDSGTITH